jgi:hypothetical protein
VAGVPAKIVGAYEGDPAARMDHNI